MDIADIPFHESFGLPRPRLDPHHEQDRPEQERYMEFVKSAKSDAGDAASRAVYGWGVDEWARRFLGDGDWTPRPIPEEGPGDPDTTRHAG
jgi:hypothetical protein